MIISRKPFPAQIMTNPKQLENVTEVTGRQGRIHKQLLDDLKETRGHCKLKVEALECTLLRTCVGRD
jgi:hypothetical protein